MQTGTEYRGACNCVSNDATTAILYRCGHNEKSLDILVYDYSHYGAARASAQSSLPCPRDTTAWISRETSYGPSSVFRDDNITTTLPARVSRMELELEKSLKDINMLTVGENGICIECEVSAVNYANVNAAEDGAA